MEAGEKYHTTALTGNISANFARAFLVNLIFDSEVDDDCLLENFVTEIDDAVKKKVLEDCSLLCYSGRML